MRTSLSVMMTISVLFTGVIAISESAQQTQPTLADGASNSSYQLAEGVFGGITQGGGIGIVWFGIAAIILVSLGFLVLSGGGR